VKRASANLFGRFLHQERWKVRLLAGVLAGTMVWRTDACTRMTIRLLWTKDPRSSASLFRIVQDGKVGFIDGAGRVVVAPQFDEDNCETGDFSEGLATVKVEDKWGYIDKHGRMRLPAIYDHACWFRDDVALVYP